MMFDAGATHKTQNRSRFYLQFTELQIFHPGGKKEEKGNKAGKFAYFFLNPDLLRENLGINSHLKFIRGHTFQDAIFPVRLKTNK